MKKETEQLIVAMVIAYVVTLIGLVLYLAVVPPGAW